MCTFSRLGPVTLGLMCMFGRLGPVTLGLMCTFGRLGPVTLGAKLGYQALGEVYSMAICVKQGQEGFRDKVTLFASPYFSFFISTQRASG